MEDGFIPLGRSFFSHHLWEEERTYSRAEAWLDLIREAAWKNRKQMLNGKLIEVPRGGIVAAVRFLSDRWKWSNTKVCQFLEMLRLDGMITTEKRQGVTVVLLSNYERFNPSSSGAEKIEKRRGNDAETTPGRQRNDETEEGKERKQADSASGADSEIPDRATAIAQAANQGAPPDFAGYVFDDWTSRKGCDAGGVSVAFPGYVAKRWRREHEQWTAGTHKGKGKATNGHAKPEPPPVTVNRLKAFFAAVPACSNYSRLMEDPPEYYDDLPSGMKEPYSRWSLKNP